LPVSERPQVADEHRDLPPALEIEPAGAPVEMPSERGFDRPVKTHESLEQPAVILKRSEVMKEIDPLLQSQVKPERLLPEPDHYHFNNSNNSSYKRLEFRLPAAAFEVDRMDYIRPLPPGGGTPNAN
jgi:hypothetical protein